MKVSLIDQTAWFYRLVMVFLGFRTISVEALVDQGANE